MSDQDHEEFSSQIIQEEQDFFFDDESVDHEAEFKLSQEGGHAAVVVDTEHSFRHMLAGPSTHKAGLESVDKEQVNKIIYEASKGSAFFEREKVRDEAITKRIDAILGKYELIKHQDLSFETRIVDNMIRDLEESRDLSQCICHVDMDAFYASVEELADPELKKVPMAVGNMTMLCTSNYLARKFGVRSAMPGFIAMKLCPQLKLIPLHPQKYVEASNKVRAVFEKYDPNFLPMSLDEAYLNLTEYLKTTDMTPSQLVEQIRQEIFESTQLTASAGIACNRTLSKVCSDINKPNGQYYLPIQSKSGILAFVREMRVRQIPGVGRVTERVLESLGVNTCGDIFARRAVLYKLLSPISFQFMLRNYLGLGSTSFSAEVERKSMSVERTFAAMSNPDELFQKLHELCQHLEQDLEKKGLMGKNISIKIKFVTYEVRIRSKSLPSSIWTAKDIERIAKPLLIKELPMNIRLMGIRISSMKQRGTEDESVRKYFTKLPLPEYDSTIAVHTPPTNPPVIEAPPMLVCPICNRQLILDNANFNKHVDECLSKVEVKAILKDQLDNERSSMSHSRPTPKRVKRSNNGKSLLDYYSHS
ncbi:uncharacterized protein EV154DRAFT_434804 [Mucor mucedo]|uniref:uncharacterized protein n=1 Tax=Mucor mucedo TaxID=29922 RepID=UPI00221F3F8E|nr:uncharacterized protein EV154DRAFT_434804 [Mucor mucedo]KAI7896710.1 hypothetical protein EV154DRAFT_434804 [Mucor mucedo]